MLADKGELEDYALRLIADDIDDTDDAEEIASLVADRISSGIDFEFPVDSDDLDGQILDLADSLAGSADDEDDDDPDDPFGDTDADEDDGLGRGDDGDDDTDDDMGDGDDDLF